jgi:hypothetical protein
MSERADERVLSISTGWPQARARDLAWANWASFTGHRNANGYDPLVPAERLAALGGMRPDGTVTRALLESDPGGSAARRALGAGADGRARGSGRRGRARRPLDVVIEPAAGLLRAPDHAPRSPLLELPLGAVEIEDGRQVARCAAARLRARDRAPGRAGRGRLNGLGRPDVRGRVRHARPKVLATFTTGLGVTGNQYLAVAAARRAMRCARCASARRRARRPCGW